MRSVFVHVWRVSDAQVAAVLDCAYTKEGDKWLSEVGDDPSLYIRFYLDEPVEDESWSSRFSELGPPTVSVIADISGLHEGWPEVQSLVVKLLSEFDGVAIDDGGLRLWSREEVAEDREVDGRKFGNWRK